MKLIDLVIIFGYLIGITLFGIWFSKKQETTRDYFLGDRTVPWWAIAASIVATETSTITFISVPGIAFARGGNFQFLQLVFGYMLGRVVISFLFIPSYFRGELMTVYQLLERRFGNRIKMLAASLFVVMRNIADGIRLLLTAFVLAAWLGAWGQAQGIDYAKIEILTEKIAPNLYMLSGSGGADPGHQDAAGGRIGRPRLEPGDAHIADPRDVALLPGHGRSVAGRAERRGRTASLQGRINARPLG